MDGSARARRHESREEEGKKLFTLKGGKCTRRYPRKPKRGIVHSICMYQRRALSLGCTPLWWASIAAWRETRWKRRGIAQRQGLKFSRATRESGGFLRLPKSAIWRTYLPGWRIRGKRSGPEEDARQKGERKMKKERCKRPLLVEEGGQPPTEWTTC